MVETADDSNCYMAWHVGTTEKGSDIEGLLEAAEIAAGHPLHLPHVNAYCRGASGQYLRNAPLPRKSFSNIRNLRQRATSQREMGHHLTVVLPENRAQPSLPEL